MTRKQAANLKLGAGYWITHIATPEQRKQFAKVGGDACFRKYGSAEMSRRAALANPTPEQIEQARQLGNQNAQSGFLDRIRTHDGSVRGALKACHMRWHVNRNRPNPKHCQLCAEETLLLLPAKE